MSMQKKLRNRGLVMLIVFFGLLVMIFSPVFPGKVNGLNYMDNLFNTISKGSSYFIPKSQAESAKFAGKPIDATLKMSDDAEAAMLAGQFTSAGIEATAAGSELQIRGDVAAIMRAMLADADLLFNNDGSPVAAKYGYNERQALYNWWQVSGAISKYLTAQKRFDGAKAFENLRKKALEPAYNYYGVKSESWQDKLWLILGALMFYVVYTVWYGFGLMFLFEGLGYRIGH